jgi:hypothetical protein
MEVSNSLECPVIAVTPDENLQAKTAVVLLGEKGQQIESPKDATRNQTHNAQERERYYNAVGTMSDPACIYLGQETEVVKEGTLEGAGFEDERRGSKISSKKATNKSSSCVEERGMAGGTRESKKGRGKGKGRKRAKEIEGQ